jgi:hypothetical protein
MKIISIFLGLMALLLADVAMAAGATATSVTGTVTVQTGTASARPLRQGDTVTQGDTIVTAAASSVVLRFDDGEITALTANSRMQVTAYQYNPSNNSGNVFLSLISGGMRAITGLIGRNQPSSVAYRAATATIGIRGTEVDVSTDGKTAVVSVLSGEIDFTYNGQTVRVQSGQAAYTDAQGKITSGAAQFLMQAFQQLYPDLAKILGSVDALSAAVNMSLGSEARGSETFNSTSSTGTAASGVGSSGSGGGTTVSAH